jgi:hypothetical protein
LSPGVLRALEAVRDNALAWGRGAFGAAEVRAAATALLAALPQTMMDEAVAAVLPDPGGAGQAAGPGERRALGARSGGGRAGARLRVAVRRGRQAAAQRLGLRRAARGGAAHAAPDARGRLVMRRPPQRLHGGPP